MLKLKVGDMAPELDAKDQSGNTIKLSNYKGSKVVLYFYPKDDTPGCTAEACNLRDNYEVLQKKGFKIIGVSVDNEKSHLKFIEKYKLPFPLIADTDKIVCNAYGVWGKKKFMGKEYDGISRVTFVISEDGMIEDIIEKVDTKNHTNQLISI